eukprot:7571793-Pyramimonas_sp.AAC.1
MTRGPPVAWRWLMTAASSARGTDCWPRTPPESEPLNCKEDVQRAAPQPQTRRRASTVRSPPPPSVAPMRTLVWLSLPC